MVIRGNLNFSFFEISSSIWPNLGPLAVRTAHLRAAGGGPAPTSETGVNQLRQRFAVPLYAIYNRGTSQT